LGRFKHFLPNGLMHTLIHTIAFLGSCYDYMGAVMSVFSCYAHCKLIFRLLILPGITQWRSEPSSILLVAAAMIGLRYRSRIHERTISLRFLGIILRVLRLQVSAYSVYCTLQIQNSLNPLLLGGGGIPLVDVTLNSKEENYQDFWPNYVQEFGLWTVDTQFVQLTFLIQNYDN
jgi:hypothetical protein